MTPATTIAPTNSDLNEVIAPSALVAVEFSTGFFGRIHQIISFLQQGRTPEELSQAYTQINNGQVTPGTWVQHLHTLLILAAAYQENARKTDQMLLVSDEELLKLQQQYHLN